jgi:hypothetical protein
MNNVVEMPHVTKAKDFMEKFVTDMADVYLYCCSIHCKNVNKKFSEYIEAPEDDGPLVLLKHEPDEIQAFLTMMTMEMYATMLKTYEEPGDNDN